MISGLFYFHNRNSTAVIDIKYDFGGTCISNFIFPHDKTHATYGTSGRNTYVYMQILQTSLQ